MYMERKVIIVGEFEDMACNILQFISSSSPYSYSYHVELVYSVFTVHGSLVSFAK